MSVRRLALLALVATAHAETRPHYGGTVEASLLGAPVSLDPIAATTHAEITVVDLVFDTLYRVGGDGIVQPRLATALPVLDGARTTARITIRKGVRFHDGSELTAQDVAASLLRAQRSGPHWVLAPVASVHVEGDAIELALRAPVAELPTLLALPQTAVTKGGKAPGGDRAIGSGPFAIETIDRPKRRLSLRAFDEHFAGRPYLDELVLRWYDTPDGEARRFETGTSQISARGVAAFAGALPAYRADDVEGPASLLVFAGFGRAHPEIAADRGFRHALDLAIARGALTAVGSGERVVPTRAPVPVEAGATALPTAGRAADPDAARAQLASAQQRVASLAPDKLAALRLEILVEDSRPDDREIAESVVLALDRLGIAAAITAVPAATLRERAAKGTCDLWIGQLAEPVTSAVSWWGAAFAAGGDDWADKQLATGTLDTAQAGKTFADRLPIVPLMFRAVRIWHRTDVRGLGFDASGRLDFADLFIFGEPTKTRSKP